MSSFTSAFESQHVTSTVSGQEFTFKPCTTGVILKFGGLAASLWSSLDVLMRSYEKDQGFEQEDIKDGSTGNTVARYKKPSTSPDSLKLQHDLRTKAIERLASALVSEQTRGAAGEAILNSLRGQEKDLLRLDTSIDLSNALKFFDSLPLPMAKELLVGVGKANAGAFGPLAEKVASATKAVAGKAVGAVEAAASQSQIQTNPSPSNSDNSSSSTP